MEQFVSMEGDLEFNKWNEKASRIDLKFKSSELLGRIHVADKTLETLNYANSSEKINLQSQNRPGATGVLLCLE